LIIATAGHVDHGKTSLVKNLTGVETDRLEEEQRRGLSINLGYAFLPINDESTLGFIDVPGHRRFINNMISGITGIDLGMLIVAADDGLMPQTYEHVQVMNLLGVETYLLVVTKCDRVDKARVEQVVKDSANLLPGATPTFRVSNTTGAGIEELRTELESLALDNHRQPSTGNFRMSVDRAFNLQGRGLVLTGTIMSGSVALNDAVILQPQQIKLRVRSMHAQDAPVDVATTGERCALNISGDLHKDNIERGDWIVSENCIGTTSRFDARIHLLPEVPFALKHLSEVKLHIGAKRLQAKIMLLRTVDAPSRICPGETAWAQLLTERPILCCRGDRVLLRDQGEQVTLGGGVVLDPRGQQKGKSSEARLKYLAAMEQNTAEDAIRSYLVDDKFSLNYSMFISAWNIAPPNRPGAKLPEIARVSTTDGEIWLPESRWTELKQLIVTSLSRFHETNPSEAGTKVTELMHTALPVSDQTFFQSAVTQLIESGDVIFREGLLSAKGHIVVQSTAVRNDWAVLATYLKKQGRHIPSMSLLSKEISLGDGALTETINRAVRTGQVFHVGAKRIAHIEVLRDFVTVALALTADGTALTLAEYRDALGCGRNVVVDVLEFFDSIRFTRRTGESRIIHRRTMPEKLIKQ